MADADTRPEVQDEVQDVVAEALGASVPEPAKAADPVEAPPARRSGGFMGTVLGGVIAAGLGFGLSQYGVSQGWPYLTAAPDQTGALDTLKAEIARLDASIKELPTEARVKAVEAAMPKPAPDLTPRLTALEARLKKLEAIPLSDGGVSPAALAQMADDIAALKAGAGTAGNAAAVAEAKAAAEAAQAQLAKAEAQAADAKTAAEATTKAAAVSAALTELRVALDTGTPFATAAATLLANGATLPPVLQDAAEGGVPTLTALQDSFPAAARAALEACLRANMGDTVTQRLTSFLRSQTGARSLTPKDGTDPDAVLSRAEAALKAADLKTAITELAALPAEGQPAIADWVAQAQHRLDATDALAALAAAPAQN